MDLREMLCASRGITRSSKRGLFFSFFSRLGDRSPIRRLIISRANRGLRNQGKWRGALLPDGKGGSVTVCANFGESPTLTAHLEYIVLKTVCAGRGGASPIGS